MRTDKAQSGCARLGGNSRFARNETGIIRECQMDKCADLSKGLTNPEHCQDKIGKLNMAETAGFCYKRIVGFTEFAFRRA